MTRWLILLFCVATLVATPFVVPRATSRLSDGRWKRIRLRTLLYLTAIVALLLVAIPATRDSLKWDAAKNYAKKVFVEVQRSEARTCRTITYKGIHWTFANYPGGYELREDPLRPGQKAFFETINAITPETEQLTAEGVVYVHPPGVWVGTPQEAIQLLRNNL